MREETEKRLLVLALVVFIVFCVGGLIGACLPPRQQQAQTLTTVARAKGVDVGEAIVNGIVWSELVPLNEEDESVGWQQSATHPFDENLQFTGERLVSDLLAKAPTNRRLTRYMAEYNWRLELAPVTCRSRAEIILVPQVWLKGPVGSRLDQQADGLAIECQRWVGRFLLARVEQGPFAILVSGRSIDTVSETSLNRLMWESDNNDWSRSVAAFDASMMLALTHPDVTVMGEGAIVGLNSVALSRRTDGDRYFELRRSVARVRDRVVASRATRLLNDENVPVLIMIEPERLVPVKAELQSWGVRVRVWTPPSLGIATIGDRWV